MEPQKLTQEEIDQLSQLQLRNKDLIIKFGQLEMEIQSLDIVKKQLIEEFNELKLNELGITKLLQSKYGDGNINLGTGEITPLS